MFKFGDILIINFPFSNSIGSKRRPVLVLKDTRDSDVLVIKITSKNYGSLYDVEIVDWQYAGLLAKSIARISKIQTIHASLIFAHIGKLSSTDIQSTKEAIKNLLTNL